MAFTVLSLAANLPGPLAAAQLTRSGAHVIKVEPPHGDALRLAAPDWYAQLTEGQDVLELDLRDYGDTERLQSLLADTDLLLTSSRPGSLAKFGLAWNELHLKFARLCQVAIVGDFNEAADVAGHDLTYQAQAGILLEPRVPAILAADVLAAQCAVSAAFELLYARERNGVASYKEVSIAQAARSFSASILHGLTSSDGILGGASPFYNVYRTADGWVAVAAIEPHFRDRLLKLLALETEDKSTFERIFLTQTSEHWEMLAREHDVPIVKVMGLTNIVGE